jgi:hypothetical protein
MKSSFLDRLNVTYRELGLLKTLLYLTNRGLGKLHPDDGFFFYRFVAQPVAVQRRLPLNRGKAFRFRVLNEPEPVLDALDRPAEVISGRFSQGAQCLAALKEDRLVGCIWFVRGSFAEDEVRADYWLPSEGTCVWDFDVFVAKSERLGFLFPKLWDTFDAQMRPEGVFWTLSRIDSLNQRSLASHRSLGAADFGWALFLRIGKLELMVSDLSPYLHAGCRTRPAFRLTPPVAHRTH